MIDINDDKYKTQNKYPLIRRAKYPKPNQNDFQNWTQYGIAMDAWNIDVIEYDVIRPKLIKEFNVESKRVKKLFMDDVIYEMGWSHLSETKKNVIATYLWTQGSSYQGILDNADDIDDLVEGLISENEDEE